MDLRYCSRRTAQFVNFYVQRRYRSILTSNYKSSVKDNNSSSNSNSSSSNNNSSSNIINSSSAAALTSAAAWYIKQPEDPKKWKHTSQILRCSRRTHSPVPQKSSGGKKKRNSSPPFLTTSQDLHKDFFFLSFPLTRLLFPLFFFALSLSFERNKSWIFQVWATHKIK